MRLHALCAIGAIIAGAAVLSPSAAAADNAAAAEHSPLKREAIPWSKKMQELYKTLSGLLTDVCSDRRYDDPANKGRIQAEVDRLSTLIHDLNRKEMVKVDVDPTIPIVAGILGKEVKRAAAELRRGNRGYARGILRAVPSYCIACHTRNETGSQFAALRFEPTSGSLNALEKGEFFAASRQFDRAQNEFKKVIRGDAGANLSTWQWQRAVQHSLAIAVRVKKDPVQAQEVVQEILKAPSAPAFAKESAKAWSASITDWQNEPRHEAMTEEGLRAEAIRLMAKAKEVQTYPMDRTADVLYLRASAAAHDLLQVGGPRASEALFLAGLTYEVLSPLKMESLQDVFYEACIRRDPHTPTAELCYQRLESGVILGYSGSAGTSVPLDVRHKLQELRALSQLPINIQK